MEGMRDDRFDWSFTALLAAAFACGFSLPLGRALLAVSLVALAIDIARGRKRLRIPATAWLWIALSVLAAVVTYYGVNPAKGLHRLPKLLWYIGIPIAASAVDSREKAWAVVRAFVLGTGVLALRLLAGTIPAAMAAADEINEATAAFEPLLEAAFNRGSVSEYAFHSLHHALPHPTFMQTLFDQGDLGDSQRLMAGLAGAVAILIAPSACARGEFELRLAVRGRSLRIPVWEILTGLVAVALFLTFKRSSWIGAAAVLLPMLARRVKWKKIAIGAIAAIAIVLAIPAGRARIAQLSGELSMRNGGRIAMWTQVAPGVIRDHPWGIGFRAMTPELMRQYYRRVERDREHLHSNPIEMTSSLGWLGLAIYLAWVALSLRDAARLDNGTPQSERGLSCAVLGMLAALYVNGLVEYNFADAELVLPYGILTGLAAAIGKDD